MIESSVRKDLILNGTNSIATFNKDGVIYRAEPLPLIQEIKLGRLAEGETKIIDFKEQLTQDYVVVGLLGDITPTENELKGIERNGAQPVIARLSIDVYLKDELVINLDSMVGGTFYQSTVTPLKQEHTWGITPSREVNNIMLLCKPTYIEKTILFP